MTTGKLYRTIEVWRRQDDQTAIRYVCFEDLDTQRFWVKSADHIKYPLDKSAMAALNLQAAEFVLDSLIFEGDEEQEFREWSPSLRLALEKFDRAFENS